MSNRIIFYALLSIPNQVEIIIKTLFLSIKKNIPADNGILTIASGLNGGGAERIADQLISSISENDRFALLGSKENLAENYIETSSLKPRVGKWLRQFQAKTGLMDIYYLNPAFFSLDKRFNKVSIIHLHNIHSGFFSPLALPFIAQNRQVVWTLHDMYPFTGHCSHSLDCERWLSGCGSCPYPDVYPPIQKDKTAFLINIKKRAYQNIDMTVVCPSHWIMEKAKRSVLKDKKFILIPNGVDTDMFYPQDKQTIRKELGLPENGIIFLFAANKGRANPWKGGVFYEKLADSFADKVNVYFISIGDEEKKRNGNSISLPFVRDQRQLSKYYNASDALIYPSLADNCPLTVLEAQACGVPVVAFTVGGLPELLRHKETGYLAKSGNFEDLVSGAAWIIEIQPKKDIIAKASRDNVLKYFSLSGMLESYKALYRSMGWSK